MELLVDNACLDSMHYQKVLIYKMLDRVLIKGMIKCLRQLPLLAAINTYIHIYIYTLDRFQIAAQRKMKKRSGKYCLQK